MTSSPARALPLSPRCKVCAACKNRPGIPSVISPSHTARCILFGIRTANDLFAITLSVEREALSAACRSGAASWGDFLGRRPCLRCRIGALFAGAVGVQEEPAIATDRYAAVTFRALAFGTDQRADPIGLNADGIERIE